MDIRVTVSGLESIDQDLEAELGKIQVAAQSAMTNVARETAYVLKSHIEHDVYDAYTPKVYQRRSKDPGLGRPLSDIKSYFTAHVHPLSAGVWAGVDMYYQPKGEHTVSAWADADGNDLIRRIEENNPPYKWPPTPVERPFWQNFVTEMTNSGKFGELFAASMLVQGYNVESKTDVERDTEDGQY